MPKMNKPLPKPSNRAQLPGRCGGVAAGSAAPSVGSGQALCHLWTRVLRQRNRWFRETKRPAGGARFFLQVQQRCGRCGSAEVTPPALQNPFRNSHLRHTPGRMAWQSERGQRPGLRITLVRSPGGSHAVARGGRPNRPPSKRRSSRHIRRIPSNATECPQVTVFLTNSTAS